METERDVFLLPCATPQAEPVVNRNDEELGDLGHVVIDAMLGKVAYAVLVRGGVLGLGERLHAIPWDALEVDARRRRFVLDIEKERLDTAPAFDDEHWPTMESTWADSIRAFYAALRGPAEPVTDR